MESKREHFESNPIIFPGITLNSEQILVLTLDLVGSMIGFYQKCSIFDSTIHMGGVTIRKRTVEVQKPASKVAFKQDQMLR